MISKSLWSKVKKYSKILLPVVVLLLSIKPAIFTWNLIMANYLLQHNPGKAEDYISAGLAANPSSYEAFKKYHSDEVKQLVVTTAIRAGEIKTLEEYGMTPQDIAVTVKTYKDNFYFRYVSGSLDRDSGEVARWQNLDEVSFRFLADEKMNALTLSILKKVSPGFSPGFTANLADYCAWKKNKELEEYLAASSPGDALHGNGIKLMPLNASKSQEALNKIMVERYGLQAEHFKTNLLKGMDFLHPDTIENNWNFSDMAGIEPFGDGSFTMGPDSVGENGNLRIMGFYVHCEQGQSRPRGGAWYKDNISLEEGCYLFAFDYATKTGNEHAAFWLSKNLAENRVPHTSGNWKKVVVILDNRQGQTTMLKPLVRIRGTGSLWIDNIVLAKITRPNFSIDSPRTLHIQSYEGILPAGGTE